MRWNEPPWWSTPFRIQDPGEVVPRGEDCLPSIAIVAQFLRCRREPEIAWFRDSERLPREWHRNRRRGDPPRRIRRVESPAAAVHIVIEKDLAGALLNLPVHRQVFGMQPHQRLSAQTAHLGRLIGPAPRLS